MSSDITPPPELVEEWRNLPEYVSQLRAMSTVTITTERLQDIATQAARWGSDQELEACIQYFHEYDPSWGEDSELIAGLRAARRPKPPSLRERALQALERVPGPGADPAYLKVWADREAASLVDAIRRALEALDD